MRITDQLTHISNGEFWLLVAALGLLSAGCFVWAFRLFHRGRIIENTATAKIRSAQQGYVELKGEARPVDETPLAAPLTGRPCCWYRCQIDKRANKGWRRVEVRVSDDPFLLRDETGECLIYPEGAEVHAVDQRVWYGDTRAPSPMHGPRDAGREGFAATAARWLTKEMGSGRRYRYSETCIGVGDRLYAAGLFKSLDDIDHNATQKSMTLEILRGWKEDQAALVKNFDTNGDGRLDAEEWERARIEAARIARLRQRRAAPDRHLHLVRDPRSRRHPFLLATVRDAHLIRHFRMRAGIAITAFFLSGGITILMLGQRLG